MPINGAGHKYKSLYEITFLTFISLPGPLCVCVGGWTEMCEFESYWFYIPFCH